MLLERAASQQINIDKLVFPADYKSERFEMSKKIKPRLRAALILAAAMLTLGARPGTAQQAPAAATVNPKSAAVIAATTEVLRETSEIRQLAILRQVRSGAQSRAEIERMIMRNLNENTTPEEIRASELALKKLGLAPADFKLREFIVQLLTEQVAGYYDPKAREFYLADWIDLDGQKPVIAHELTHALQDQHFNLRRFEKMAERRLRRGACHAGAG